jgi:hypothetical protein
MRADDNHLAAYGEATEAVCQPARASDLRTPSVLRCGLMILSVKLSLKICGFARTIEWIRTGTATRPCTTSFAADAVVAAEHAVALAAAFYPGRARCLEQSLALYYLLRRRGSPSATVKAFRPSRLKPMPGSSIAAT